MTTVTTQKELDAAIAAEDPDIIIKSPQGVWLEVGVGLSHRPGVGLSHRPGVGLSHRPGVGLGSRVGIGHGDSLGLGHDDGGCRVACCSA